MLLTRTTAPTSEPVTLAEMKTHLRVDSDITGEDTLIESLTQTARELVEEQTGRGLLEQVWTMTFDDFPGRDGAIEMTRHPVVSIDSIKYDDEDGQEVTLAEAAYYVVKDADRCLVFPAPDTEWPYTQEGKAGNVRIEFTVGYEDAASVPGALKTAIKLLCGHWFANRESVVVGTVASDVPQTISFLLAQWRTQRY